MCKFDDASIRQDEESTLSSTTTTSSQHQEPNSASTYLSSLLASTLVITITDGRSFVGHFICTDKDQNIILNQAEEFLPRTVDKEYESAERPVSVGAWGGREVGMVMFRGRDIVKIEAQLPLDLQDGGSERDSRGS